MIGRVSYKVGELIARDNFKLYILWFLWNVFYANKKRKV